MILKKALMSYSKKATEQPDFFIRCQSDLEDAVPELVAEIKEKFLVPRTAKTDTEPFRERFGFRLPDDIADYINLFWHTSIYGAYDCFKQIENGDGYYKFDEGLVLFPVLKHNGGLDDDVLFQESGVFRLTEELYEDYEEDDAPDLVREVKDYICIGWTEYSAFKILYKVSTGEVYLESSMADRVADDKPIAGSLCELIGRLYFLS